MDDKAMADLRGWLENHESDIAEDINDYGDLAWVFESIFGHKPVE